MCGCVERVSFAVMRRQGGVCRLGGGFALFRYVPAGGNVARATRSVLSLVSSERVEVGEAQQAKRRATASNETQVNCARSSQSAPFSAPDASEEECRALVVGAGSGGSMLGPGVGAVAWSGSGGACVSSPPAVGCCSRQPSPYGVEKGVGG